MVGIAQLVEHLVVVQGAAGSSPVTHPKEKAEEKSSAFCFSEVTGMLSQESVHALEPHQPARAWLALLHQ